MAIDPIVSALQGQESDHWVLAFAGDLCLLADSAPALQLKVDEARAGLEPLGLKINASKCASLHLSGRHPVVVRESVFTILGAPMKPLAEGEAAVFLGAQVGFHVIPISLRSQTLLS
ncbi:unnamed protein product [Macrosiphum euphorbiae]|uniref:Reverse transcriptase domain-containing protein n=1 Tax=Macrosiphum euphorbiae TaxID=13131 RepID=A0AAV0WKM8_9HEMI|nr:unnamed protein product [Macrosiphum euphorbiae]